MLKLDTTLTAVETAEADVESLFQSVNQVDIALEGYVSQPCEAFVCGINPGDGGKVFAAIFLTRERKVLVYTTGNLGTDRKRYEEALHEAQDFLEPLGFQLKQVNLSYSAAMKQVILKGIAGIKLPGTAKPEWKQKLEQVVATQRVEAVANAKETARKGLKPQVSLPETPKEKPAAQAAPPPRKKAEGDDISAMLRVEIARLEDELASVTASTVPLKTRVKSLEGELERERQKVSALEENRESEKREGEKAAAATSRTIAALKKELDAVKGELAVISEQSEGERSSLQKQLAAQTARQQELEAKTAAELKELSGRLKKSEAALEESKSARSELEQRLTRQEEENEAEMVRLVALLAETEVRGDEQLREYRIASFRRLAAIRQIIDGLWESVGDESMPTGDDLLQLLAGSAPVDRVSQSPAQRAAIKEAAQAREPAPSPKAGGTRSIFSPAAEPPPAPEEAQVSPKEEPVIADTAEGQPSKLDTETALEALAPDEGVEEEEAEAPGEEKTGAETAAKSRVAELFYPEESPTADQKKHPAELHPEPQPEAVASPPEKPSTPPAWVTAPLSSASPDMLSDFDLSGGFGGQAVTPFLLDESQGGLTVAADDLLEMHRSANVQRIAPTGGAPEEGNAYVCAFREGKKERVVVIVQLAKDRQRFVYLPQDPSFDRDALVRSALTFVEDIGFFMLAEPLGETGEERKANLEEWASFVRWD